MRRRVIPIGSYMIATESVPPALGLPQGKTALDELAFQTRPLYAGNPWFLAPSVAYYRWRDSRRV